MKAIAFFPFVNDLRDRFLPAYASLTPEELEQKVTGSPNSIGFYLRHIAQAEDWFVQGLLKGGNVQPKRKAQLPTITEILGYLQETRAGTLEYLAAADADEFTRPITIPDGFRGEPVENPTVGWLLHRIFDHEVYHLAQVNMTLRLMGKEPPKM
ncbi:DinB family protein [Aneurinibacillus sp. Ricciae_BoGa-3]|uniref:DinB family protein n=1 Tax=Aneurinibacillus sp. Ricciae_BoGa-3 TaxID=3022697 RepID=UPI00234217A1|nr:DinB family protein [Aneurinibacillus sp. Ricciae_BoGa-3]WCK55628.1 DinB family protein [Aneurinibacillus sp. Ricciae_BoGa-3]